MLKIRLQRIGKRGQAYFRMVVVEHTKKPKGKFLELLGTYDPHLKKFNAKKDRVEYWISKGAQVSPTANNLMVNFKIWERPKMMSWKPKKKAAQTAAIPQTAPAAVETPTEPAAEAPATEAPAPETSETSETPGTPTSETPVQ